MELVYAFRKLVFWQVLLGIVAFCIAEQNVAMLLMAGAPAGLSWYVTEGPAGKPLPRWSVNLLALVAVAWLGAEMVLLEPPVIQAMGHFTIWLQVLLLYAPKSNRDYGFLLALSMLQVVGASVLSVSMIFGLLLAMYCVLALSTVLTFHLKGSADAVHDARHKGAIDPEAVARPAAVGGLGRVRQFRLVTVGLGVLIAFLAAGLFVLIPRTGEPRLPEALAGAGTGGQATTGFSSTVDLNTSPSGAGSEEAVLNVTLTRDGQPIGGEDFSFLLRGAALDYFDRRGRRWVTRDTWNEAGVPLTIGSGVALTGEPEGPMNEARVVLRRPGERTVFTTFPTTFLKSDTMRQVVYNPIDRQLRAAGPLASGVIYSYRWPASEDGGFPGAATDPASQTPPQLELGSNGRFVRGIALDLSTYARGWPGDRGRLAAEARRALADVGLSRDPNARYTPDDGAIARALTAYVQGRCDYALDNPPAPQGVDPVVYFLDESQRGHCELFAATLAAMSRSIGMQARVVTGYRVSEFNPVGSYYVVRQRHAHAWVEVNTGPEGGWITLDPTPVAGVAAEHRPPGGWRTKARYLYEHMEYAWINAFVAFDGRTRERFINSTKAAISAQFNDPSTTLGGVIAWARKWIGRVGKSNLATVLVGVMVVTITALLGVLVRLAVRRRRRLAALQLKDLPKARRRALSRELGFYLRMLDLLERKGFHRPLWQSPYAFAESLAAEHPMRFDPVVALTELFYEVRFGGRALDDDRRTRVRAHLRQLEQNLAARDDPPEAVPA